MGFSSSLPQRRSAVTVAGTTSYGWAVGGGSSWSTVAPACRWSCCVRGVTRPLSAREGRPLRGACFAAWGGVVVSVDCRPSPGLDLPSLGRDVVCLDQIEPDLAELS
jgi:hypothetical protein